MNQNARLLNSYSKVENSCADFVKNTKNIRQRNPEEKRFRKMIVLLISLRLNFNQVAMESTCLSHIGKPLAGQLVRPASK